MRQILTIEDQEDLRELVVYDLEKEKRFDSVAVANANDALISV